VDNVNGIASMDSSASSYSDVLMHDGPVAGFYFRI